MKGAAELIADRGEAAADAEFFRSREFLDAEGVTHTLRIQAGGRELAAPIVVREIPGTEQVDATSPYGYPGLRDAGGRPIDPASIDFGPTGLVAAFLRHALGDPPLVGASERNVVQIADPAAAGEDQGERPQPDQPQPARRIRGPDRRRRRGRPRGSRRIPRRLRGDDAPHQRRRALLLRRRLLRPDPRVGPRLAGAGRRPRRWGRRGLDPGRERRLPPLLPQRQLRLEPRRLADEERGRGAGRGRRRAGPAAQPRRRDHPRRPARGVQARVREPRDAVAHLGDRLRLEGLRPPQRRPRHGPVLPGVPLAVARRVRPVRRESGRS